MNPLSDDYYFSIRDEIDPTSQLPYILWYSNGLIELTELQQKAIEALRTHNKIGDKPIGHKKVLKY